MLQDQKSKPSLYRPSLDGLRFFAFLLVFVHHLVPPDFAPLKLVSRFGWVGVDLFFTLSAFLLMLGLIERHNAYGFVSFKEFFLGRLLRIYPLMASATLIFVFFHGSSLNIRIAIEQMVAQLAFVSNFYYFIDKGSYYNIAHLWSLSFEFQFYLVLPMIFLVYSRRGSTSFFMLLAAILGLGLIARGIAISAGVRHPVIYYTPLLRPESILIGLALAAASLNVRPILVSGVGLIACTLFLSGPNVNAPGSWNVILYPLTAVMSGATVWLSLHAAPLRAILSVRPLVRLGKISFGLYVFHLPIIYLLVGISGETPSGPRYVANFVIALFATIALAEISYRYFETPFLRMKDRKSKLITRPL
ncbi:acyltransferase [Microvirga terrae]|uniref:Acyltransferase n=1 Tax=Microvirga terrae TaxID=2740529 RepID=A0ABY5RM99_9HYPH|nr:acyltransferase [Microvirga terrae]UVF18355.1 acyltransferase [Microvirga terrae]